jgi:DNA-binding NarL/FixJ family response regulator
MKKRTLGRSGLEVSAIGFGWMGLDYAYSNRLNKSESISLLRSVFDRQRSILGLIAKGLTNKEIASHLNLSARTIEMH